MSDFNAPDRDVTRAIRSWLHEDRHEDASRIAAAVLDRVESTPRRRVSWWPARRFLDMNTFAKVFVAAAAVVAVAFVGINLLPRSGSGPGGPLPSRSPTLAPSVSPQPTLARLPGSGPMEPGTYLMSDGKSSFRVTIPTGWDAAQNGRDIGKHRGQPGEVAFSLYSSDINVFPDACASQDRPPRTGPTADDLVAALRAQQNSDVSEPAGITIGGRPGQRLDVSTPQGLDVAGCFESTLRIWSGAAGGNYLAFGPPGETAPVSIVEAPSGRIVFTTAVDDTATAGDQAELQAILDSIQFEQAP